MSPLTKFLENGYHSGIWYRGKFISTRVQLTFEFVIATWWRHGRLFFTVIGGFFENRCQGLLPPIATSTTVKYESIFRKLKYVCLILKNTNHAPNNRKVQRLLTSLGYQYWAFPLYKSMRKHEIWISYKCGNKWPGFHTCFKLSFLCIFSPLS